MTKKLWLAGGVILAVAAALWWRLDVGLPFQGITTSTAPDGGRGNGVRPVAVEADAVETGSIRAWVRFSGSLTAAAQFDVATRTTGRLEQLLVDIGDTVAAGQVIARLDDEESVQQLEQARAELAVARAGQAEAQAALDAALRSLGRTRELRTQRVASQSELDTAETEASAQQARLQLTSAQIAQREAAVRGAEIRLSYTTLRASWQGDQATRVVGERYADQGTLLQANSPVLSLVAMDPLRGVVFAAQRDYARLRPGQVAQISSDALPGQQFEGKVARLAPVFRETTRQARVEIVIPNPDGLLKPGMFIQSRIQVDGRDGATLVPLDAVVERNGSKGVFRVSDDGGTAEFITVEVGIQEGNRVEILQPALLGRVVTLGQQMLSDGVPIQVSDQPRDSDR